MKMMMTMTALAAVMTAGAEVLTVTEAPKLDGRLDEPCWTAAEWRGDFRLRYEDRHADGSRTPRARTEFAVVADKDNVYVGVKAYHPRMEWLRNLSETEKTAKWRAEGFELLFCPDGGRFQYYQFLVTHQGDMFPIFRTEHGFSSPDPYNPVWERAIANGADSWTCEVRIPLSAFYMTRNGIWSPKWRVNVARAFVGSEGHGGRERSCWADVESLFNELDAFREIDGFPMRRIEDDSFIQTVIPDVRKASADGRLSGALKFLVYVAKGGDFTISSDWFGPRKITLGEGDNGFEIESELPPNGRNTGLFTLTRLSDGTSVGRRYPVVIDYRPLRVSFTAPQYRSNFYPGQCADRVAGSIKATGSGPIEILLEGPGFGRRETTLAKSGEFEFDTKGFEFGEAKLVIRCGKDELVKKVRRLKPLPEGKHMSWIENGNLVVDGRPVFRRNIYATGFMGGRAFKRKFQSDDLRLTEEITRIAEFDPGPLRNGEAQKDQMPSAKMFEKIDAGLKLGLGDSKGAYYYCVDEPEQHNLSPVYLKHVYEYVAERDPYHVLLCCSRSGMYIDVADWFEVHPYINPHLNTAGKRVYLMDFNTLGSCVDSFHPELHPDKCIGGTPTAFAYGSGDYPTFREYVLNFWCELVRGAKTMYPYAYHDLGDRASIYEGTRYMFESLEALEDVLLFAKRETLLKTQEAECALWTAEDGGKLLALLNFTGEPKTVKVPGLEGDFREFRGKRRFALKGGEEIRLEPLEALVASTRPYDAGLRTYARYDREIEVAEYARLHRGNQLAGRHHVLNGGITTSTGKKGGWRDDSIKLFDGILDVVAWCDSKKHDKFYEISFEQVPVTFDSITLWGYNADTATFIVGDGASCRRLEPCARQTKGDASVFWFDGKISPKSLRLEFPKDREIELYEIEL